MFHPYVGRFGIAEITLFLTGQTTFVFYMLSIYMAARWIQLWVFLLPPDQQDLIVTGCSWLLTVGQDIFKRAGWQHNSRLQDGYLLYFVIFHWLIHVNLMQCVMSIHFILPKAAIKGLCASPDIEVGVPSPFRKRTVNYNINGSKKILQKWSSTNIVCPLIHGISKT